MASPTPVVQILDRSDYTKSFLIPLPKAYPLPPLTTGTIRIRSRILAVTTNTFGYARLGHMLGWWDVWSAPPGLLPPYDDTSRYGRISSWGYAEVVESMHDRVPIGTKLFGYLPIGEYPEILTVEVDDDTGNLIEVSGQRKHLWNTYNRYESYPPSMDLAQNKDSLGWDAVMRVLFETSYLANRYAFSWDEKRSHPMGTQAPWGADDADLKDAIVLLMGPSGKTGLAFAHQLRRGRPAAEQPRKIIAIGSAQSRGFTQATGLFDDVILYSDYNNADVIERLGCGSDDRVLLVNFSTRDQADVGWYRAMKGKCNRVTMLIVGGDPKMPGRPELAALTEDPASGVVRCNTSGLRDKAMSVEGRSAYFGGMIREWDTFKKDAATMGMKLVWGKGMRDLADGWDALSHGRCDPTDGLVYEV